MPLTEFPLPDGSVYLKGRLPEELIPDEATFERLWDMHPVESTTLVIHGREVKAPRWDRAFGKGYRFSNQVAEPAPLPEILVPYLEWVQRTVDPKANGLFVNWHDATLGHYHGPHRDSTQGLLPGSPIVTISLGEARVFRLAPFPTRRPAIDLEFKSGEVIVLPWETNQKWYHAIPRLKRNQGRRVSVTVRAFV
jgi:alkylated DNA repair dioxygenase AlkB